MRTRDLRIESIRPLEPPTTVLGEHPLSDAGSLVITRAREEIVNILTGKDHRLVVVVGPCSVHDPEAAMDYGRRLKRLADELADDLCIIMRVYFEKPRTTIGWKGLINDPHLDGSFASGDGLYLARQLLLNLVDLGLPSGCEFLDPISPQYTADVIAWGAIGARTTESQVHRQLASGLSLPVGFKNGTDGRVQIAIDAMRAAAHPHSFFGVTEDGRAAIVDTTGNPDCHLILRGGVNGPNFDSASIQSALSALEKAGLQRRLMIDTSHDNSDKDYRRQPDVASEVAQQVAGGETGIIGILMESFLVDGRQDLIDKSDLVYGQSITDACMGWEMTEPVLRELAAATRTRRERIATPALAGR
ncbi:MAG: 3-deoxy-7-phosphoheptulonate synthase [Chloroflexota bacterium]